MSLAADLSARCDRALDRTVSLASEWQAQLTVLHVFEEVIIRSQSLTQLQEMNDDITLSARSSARR
jgi:hypothetical protein